MFATTSYKASKSCGLAPCLTVHCFYGHAVKIGLNNYFSSAMATGLPFTCVSYACHMEVNLKVSPYFAMNIRMA